METWDRDYGQAPCIDYTIIEYTILSPIVAPSLIVPPLFFNQEICHDMLKNDIFVI